MADRTNGWHGVQIVADAKSAMIKLVKRDGGELLLQP